MEDSSFMDLMIDTDEYLLDADWESDFQVHDKTNTKLGSRLRSETEFELVPEKPPKQMKTDNNNNLSSSTSSSSPTSSSRTSQVISFGSPDQNTNPVETSLNFSKGKDDGNSEGRRGPRTMKDHVLAERNRRQKLNERLIALSALLPGLKKTDKATILEDAIKHLKKLQEQVKKLEEERVRNKKMDQSIIMVTRSQMYLEDESSSYSSTCSPLSSSSDEVTVVKQTMPMIEARVSDRDLLIKVHCEKNKGCLIKILSSLERFRLDVVNSFTLPFGSSSLVITILSKMDSKFSQPVEEVVKNIRLALAE